MLLVVIGPVMLGVTGCSGSNEKSDATATARPSASSSPTVSGPPVAGTAIDGEKMFKKLTAAMIKAGGCTMTATIGVVSLDGTFALGKVDELGFPSSVMASGTVTSADAKKAQYVARLGQRFQNTGFWVNDGTPIEGRPWALVPRNTSRISDPQSLVKTHPLYMLVAQAVPLVQPDNIATLMSVRKGLVKASDSTARQAHYVWSINGKPPVAGARTSTSCGRTPRAARLVSSGRCAERPSRPATATGARRSRNRSRPRTTSTNFR